MSPNPTIESSSSCLPVATILPDKRLVFESSKDLHCALELGIFYLKVPEALDLEAAREFGRELAEPGSIYRNIPKYGDFEGFIALENNQQTKLALRRHHWDQHYPEHIANFGRQLDDIGVIVISEVLRQSGIPESCWSQASGVRRLFSRRWYRLFKLCALRYDASRRGFTTTYRLWLCDYSGCHGARAPDTGKW